MKYRSLPVEIGLLLGNTDVHFQKIFNAGSALPTLKVLDIIPKEFIKLEIASFDGSIIRQHSSSTVQLPHIPWVEGEEIAKLHMHIDEHLVVKSVVEVVVPSMNVFGQWESERMTLEVEPIEITEKVLREMVVA